MAQISVFFLYLRTSAVILLLLILSIFSGCKKENTVTSDDGSLLIPLSGVSEIVSFFSAVVDEVYMEVLAVKAADGAIRIAFNTCERCYSSGNGSFLQEEDELICLQCNMRSSIDSVGIMPEDANAADESRKYSSGCRPILISDEGITMDEKYIRISIETLSENTQWFENWKREDVSQ